MLDLRIGSPAPAAFSEAPDALLPYVQLAPDILAALAWPIAFATTIFFFRKELRELILRVRFLAMPGGLQAQFVELQVEAIRAAKTVPQGTAEPDLFDQFFSMTRSSIDFNPSAAVFETFGAVSTRITEAANQNFPGEGPFHPEAALQQFVSKKQVDPVVKDLYRRLSMIRNGALLGQSTTSEEARLFTDSARILLNHVLRPSK